VYSGVLLLVVFLALCTLVVTGVAHVYMHHFLVDSVRLFLDLCVSSYIVMPCFVFFVLCFCS